MAVLGGCPLDMAHPKHIILFVDVMSFHDAVTSYMMSQCCTCVGHQYLGGEFLLIVCQFIRFDSVTRDPRVAGV